MRIKIQAAVLLISVIAVFMALYSFEPLGRYSDCIVSEEEYGNIIEGRIETDDLVESLIFNETILFYDDTSRTFYYSLIEGSASAYNPVIEVKGTANLTKAVFKTKEITSDVISNNDTIEILAYSEGLYSRYFLKCTTLPLMNIQCEGEIGDEDIPMSILLFDNSLGAVSRTTVSDGKIHVRGATTKVYPKKGYRFSLRQLSLGGHTRDNNKALLGLRQDDDWLLYPAYNDQEKIRNVFSSNLWKASCAADNAQKISAGMEYKYIELFINNEYWGLYALGYPIDKKQMALDEANPEDTLYKAVLWPNEDNITINNEGFIEGFVIKGDDGNTKSHSQLIRFYEQQLSVYDDINVSSHIDADNLIDVYLFFNIIQGFDNVGNDFIKNQYIAVRKGSNGLTALYAPWDMDITWGNEWVAEIDINYTVPYAVPPSVNRILESGYLNHRLQTGDEELWTKLFDKYHCLREGVWSDESISTMLDKFERDIYDSGAYLRDMQRWPDGTYANPDDGLKVFKKYVLERMHEADLYYERLEGVHKESIFIQRAAKYKNIENCSFVLEINNQNLLEYKDYTDVFQYMGIDIKKINDDVRYIIRNKSTDNILYLNRLDDEVTGDKIEFEIRNDGIYDVYLEGVYCYTTTDFQRPDIELFILGENFVSQFNFDRQYDSETAELVDSSKTDFEIYFEGLEINNYNAIIEINNNSVLNEPAYAAVFSKLGIPIKSLGRRNIDMIVWNGSENKSHILESFHKNENTCETSIGVLGIFEGENDIYGVYLDDVECLVSTGEEREVNDIRIVLIEPDTNEVIEVVSF